MRLKETDWNARGGAADVEVEYPDKPIQEFVNWIRKSAAWRENPELVERKVRHLNGLLMDHRNAVAAGKVKPTETPSGTEAWLEQYMADPKVRADVERRLKGYRADQAKANRKAALEKARAAKAAKREPIGA